MSEHAVKEMTERYCREGKTDSRSIVSLVKNKIVPT